MIVTFARDGQEIARHEEAEVAGLLATGQLLATDHYWHEGMAAWGTVGERTWPADPPAPAPAPASAASRPALKIHAPRKRKANPVLALAAVLVWGGVAYLYHTRPAPPPAPAAEARP